MARALKDDMEIRDGRNEELDVTMSRCDAGRQTYLWGGLAGRRAAGT